MADKGKKAKQKGTPGFNRKNSRLFLAKNRSKPGVAETSSGLQYLIRDETNGIHPTITDTVVVHQRIFLIDGTPIDDTYKKDEPAVFAMAEAIAGYQEGLLMMGIGSRFRFFIPHELAWGKRGAGSKIGPYATLIIDARLIEIRK